MGYMTGEGGVIDGEHCLRHFLVDWGADPGEGYCSNSEAGPFGARGNEDWFVLANGYGAEPARLPGDTFTFKGADRDGSGKEGPAIMEILRVHVDVEPADLLWYEMLAYGTGELTTKATGVLSISDANKPVPLNARGLSVWFDDDEFSIRRARLDVMCLNAVHNDTDTNGFTGRGRGNFKANFEISMYYNDVDTLPTEHSLTAFKLEVTQATSWNLSYMYLDKVIPKVDVEGDRDGRAKENFAIVRGRWWGWSASVQGSIVAPSLTQVWPVP